MKVFIDLLTGNFHTKSTTTLTNQDGDVFNRVGDNYISNDGSTMTRCGDGFFNTKTNTMSKFNDEFFEDEE